MSHSCKPSWAFHFLVTKVFKIFKFSFMPLVLVVILGASSLESKYWRSTIVSIGFWVIWVKHKQLNNEGRKVSENGLGQIGRWIKERTHLEASLMIENDNVCFLRTFWPLFRYFYKKQQKNPNKQTSKKQRSLSSRFGPKTFIR